MSAPNRAAAPLQRTVTVANGGGYFRHCQVMRNARAAQPATAANVQQIRKGVGIIRAQTQLGPEAFAAAVTAVLESESEQPAPPPIPTMLSLEERVSAAQVASSEYVRRYGLPCNAVFGDSYIPAISYVGAVIQAERLGLMAQVRNYAGAGGGAVIAALLAAGIPLVRVGEIVARADFAGMMHVGRFPGRKFAATGGMVSGKRFVRDFRLALRMAIVDDRITMRGLHEKTGGRLVIVAVNMSTTTPVYIDYRTHPDLPLWEAVRMAVGIPAVVRPHKYAGDYYMDAGMIAGLPMNAFHHNDAAHPINQRTIGFLAVCDGISDKPRDSLGAKLSAITDCALSSVQRTSLDEQDRARTIVIDCGKMSALDFAIGPDARSALVDIGANAVVTHFAIGAVPITDKYTVAHNGFSVDDEPPMQDIVTSVLQRGATRKEL